VSIQHGDVKPQNLLLVGSGVKVGDFGLLRSLQQSVAFNQTGGVTMAYAAPEVLQGQIARHSDQYSLAVAWCELRGGRLPFGGGPVQQMAGHLKKEPDLSMLPQPERPALRRALAKQPMARWPSCAAFVEALRAAAAAPLPGTAAVRAPRDAHTTGPSGPTLRARPRRSAEPRTAAPAPPRRGWGVALGLALTALLGAGLALGAIWLLGTRPQGRTDDRNVPRDAADRDAPPKDDAKRDRDAPPVDPPRRGPQPFANSIGMRFVPIPPGEFVMGSPPEEAERADDETPHRVRLTQGFYLSARLVTQEQWERVLGKGRNQSLFSGDKSKLPIDNVSWDDCQDFCRELGKLDGRAYRLATEAEWEYACRAGSAAPFWFGETISSAQADYDSRYAYGKGDKGPYRQKTTAVDELPANPWGLYDVHGNLMQWCQDWYGPYPTGDVVDPKGPSQGEARVLRGGSWLSYPSKCRAAHRDGNPPDVRSGIYGCRVVCLVE
jgi:formylglycine-generating enzyme required for sulfatase activity